MLGELIQRLRERLPHFAKSAKFARVIGCTREHYRRIESSSGFPSSTLLQKIIEALEVSRDQADGVWIAWGMEQVPGDIHKNIKILRSTVSRKTADAVLEELRLMYPLGDEDERDLREIIEQAIKSEEVPWRD